MNGVLDAGKNSFFDIEVSGMGIDSAGARKLKKALKTTRNSCSGGAGEAISS